MDIFDRGSHEVDCILRSGQVDNQTWFDATPAKTECNLNMLQLLNLTIGWTIAKLLPTTGGTIFVWKFGT